MLNRLSASGLVSLIAGLAILLFGITYLWVVGSAVAIDETGEVQTAFVITSDGRRQPLSQLWSGYFYAIPQLEGTLQVRCHNGTMNEAGYVTPHAHTKIRVVGDTPCGQLLEVF